MAIADVERIYRERLPAGGTILDCMSSWVSHLPADVAYDRVVGLGMNAAELSRNPRLAEYVVHDLNRDPHLPFDDHSFDAATICVSIQYLTKPVEVLRDLARVVRAGGPVIITFSNRCFPTKAVAVWRSLSDRDHLNLVASYLADAGWSEIESLASPPRHADPLYAVIAVSPL
jgi:SAM-dependent methyltransferase